MTSIARRRVLVVDDDEGIRKFTARALDRAGYEVVSASGGPDALRLVEQKQQFDIFIIDLQMGQMQGDELAHRIRRLDPDAKVLYFTGFKDRLFENRKVLLKNEACLEKPVTVNVLREAVARLIGRAPA